MLAVDASSCTSGFSFFPRMEKPFPLHQLRTYLAALFPAVRNMDLMGDAFITTLRPPCPMSSERDCACTDDVAVRALITCLSGSDQ